MDGKFKNMVPAKLPTSHHINAVFYIYSFVLYKAPCRFIMQRKQIAKIPCIPVHLPSWVSAGCLLPTPETKGGSHQLNPHRAPQWLW